MSCQLLSDAIWSSASDDEPGTLYLACLRLLEQWDDCTLLFESWSESLFAPPLTKHKWLEKVTFSFFKEVLQQLQGNLNKPWMYLEGEDSFHPHLWMLSCGNDLSKSRTFSSLFYYPERKLLVYTDTNQELAWIFSYSESFFFHTWVFSFSFSFPICFNSWSSFFSPFFLWTFTMLPAAHCLSTFPLQFLQNTAWEACHSFWSLHSLVALTLTSLPHLQLCCLLPSTASGGGTVSIQVGSSLTFLHGFKCQQTLRLPRLFTECSFLRLWFPVLRSCFETRKCKAHERTTMTGVNGSLQIIIAKVAPAKLL